MNNLLFLVIAIFLYTNYTSVEEKKIARMVKKTEILKQKIERQKILLSEREKIETLYKKGIVNQKEKLAYFYDANVSRTIVMSNLQKFVESSLNSAHIKDGKIDWIPEYGNENKTFEKFGLSVNFYANMTRYHDFISYLYQSKKIIYVEKIEIYRVLGKYKGKKVQFIMQLYGYREKKNVE